MTDYLNDTFDWADPGLVSAYDELPLWSAPFGLLLLEHLPLGHGLRVLDIGCGTGFPLLELAQRLGPSSRVVGIDLWQAALRRARMKAARHKVLNADLAAGDGTALPYPDNCFHLVVSNLGINNFDFPLQVLEECWRVLRRGGRVALTTNLRGHMRELYEVLGGILKEFGQPEWLDRLDRHIEHRATVESVRLLLEEADFSLGRVDYKEFPMRFTDGSALLRHSFIKAGFLDGWREVVGRKAEEQFFSRLEQRLNRYAQRQGGLSLTIPVAYIEGVK